MAVIRMEHITKSFRDSKVLDDISLELEKGKIYGLVGLNGKKKTMLMNVLAGTVLPQKGTLELLGKKQDMEKKQKEKGFDMVRKKIGFLIEEPIFYPNMNIRDNLRTIQLIKGQKDKEEIEEVVKLIGLDGVNERTKKMQVYSLGMRQRYGIGAALIGKPEVLVLDEPTNGLDIEGLREVRGILEQLRDEGVTMLISSHNLNDLYKIAETFFFMKKGKFVAQWKHEQITKWLEKEDDIEALVRPIIGEGSPANPS